MPLYLPGLHCCYANRDLRCDVLKHLTEPGPWGDACTARPNDTSSNSSIRDFSGQLWQYADASGEVAREEVFTVGLRIFACRFALRGSRFEKRLKADTVIDGIHHRAHPERAEQRKATSSATSLNATEHLANPWGGRGIRSHNNPHKPVPKTLEPSRRRRLGRFANSRRPSQSLWAVWPNRS